MSIQQDSTNKKKSNFRTLDWYLNYSLSYTSSICEYNILLFFLHINKCPSPPMTLIFFPKELFLVYLFFFDNLFKYRGIVRSALAQLLTYWDQTLSMSSPITSLKTFPSLSTRFALFASLLEERLLTPPLRQLVYA